MNKNDVRNSLNSGATLYYAAMTPFFVRIGVGSRGSTYAVKALNKYQIEMYSESTLRTTAGEIINYARIFQQCWKSVNKAYRERISQLQTFRDEIDRLNDKMLQEAEDLGYIISADADDEITAVGSPNGVRRQRQKRFESDPK